MTQERCERIELRVTPEEKAFIADLARQRGVSMTELLLAGVRTAGIDGVRTDGERVRTDQETPEQKQVELVRTEKPKRETRVATDSSITCKRCGSIQIDQGQHACNFCNKPLR